MKQIPRALFLFSVLVASGFGQTLSNSSLTGKYFLRHVQFTTNSTNTVTDARSIVGAITFDGAGNYSFTGQQVVGTNGTTSFSATGTYSVTPAGFVTLTNPQNGGLHINARYGAEALVGSGTEVSASTFDQFIAIPAPSGSPALSNSALAVNYHMVDFELTNASTSQVRVSGMAAQFNGAGGIATFSPLGHVASFQNGAVQNVEQFTGTYGVNSDGTGTMAFAPVAGTTNAAGQLLASPTRNLYISATGNVFFAATPTAHDLLIGVQNAATSNNAFSGRYWYVGLNVTPGATQDYVASASVIGSASIYLFTARVHQVPVVSIGVPTVFTTTQTASYAPLSNSFGTTCGCGIGSGGNAITNGNAFILGGNDGTEVSVSPGEDASGNAYPNTFQISFGEQIPTLTGTGVFVNPQGIVNASTYAPVGDNISPGEFIQIYGSGLAAASVSASALPFPPSLGNVTVAINGVNAPLYNVSPGVITCIVPFELTGTTATIVVTNNGTQSNSVTVGAAPATPGVIASNDFGFGEGAITHVDNSLVTSAHPAVGGEPVQMYVTGLGTLTTPVSDGNGFSGVNNATLQPFVEVNGTLATVFYAGSTPDAGLDLIDFYVPIGTPSGEQTVTVTSTNGSIAELTATITIPVQ